MSSGFKVFTEDFGSDFCVFEDITELDLESSFDSVLDSGFGSDFNSAFAVDLYSDFDSILAVKLIEL